MSHEIPYSRELSDIKFQGIHNRLDTQDKALEKILAQTTAHNGRMSKIERTLLIVGTVSAVLLVTNGSELVKFLMSII